MGVSCGPTPDRARRQSGRDQHPGRCLVRSLPAGARRLLALQSEAVVVAKLLAVVLPAKLVRAVLLLLTALLVLRSAGGTCLVLPTRLGLIAVLLAAVFLFVSHRHSRWLGDKETCIAGALFRPRRQNPACLRTS